MKVALWGYYGPNYGDNVMLEVIINYFNSKSIKFEIVDLFGVDQNIELHKNSRIVKFNNFNKLRKIYELYKLSNKDTINIWGGGTIFTDSDGDGNFKYFKLIKLFGGRFSYLGIGIGKLTIKERVEKAVYLLSKCDFAIFRDSSSLKKANELTKNKDYYLAEDLSYIYFNKFEVKHVKYDEYVLITWRNLIGYMSKDKEKKIMLDIVDACSKLCNEININNILLLPLDHKFDIESCNIIAKMFNDNFNVKIDLDNSIDNITNLICNTKFHFSGRLHGCIASEILGIPAYGISYSPKMEYFYKSISSSNYFNIYTEKIVYEKIKSIIKCKKLYSKNELLKKANENFELLNKLLDKYEM